MTAEVAHDQLSLTYERLMQNRGALKPITDASASGH